MSRNIPIFVEPGYDSTFNKSRSSKPATGHFDTRHHRHPRFNDTDRIQEEFEDASNRFFEKNFRRRHTDFPDSTFSERDFRSDSPSRYQERPFRRGSNPSDFPSIGRRARFDEMISRMMREDSDNFDFWDPEYGNFHVERTSRNRHSPKSARKSHEKVTESPSAAVSGERSKGKFDRQSSSPSTSTTVDDEGFVDIPVVVCKDETKGKMGKDERQKPETEEIKIKSVTPEDTKEEVSTEGTGNQKFQKEKESKDHPELTVKISVDSSEEKSDEDKEQKDCKKKDVERQENVKSEKSVNEQESQQTAHMPQESQQTAQMPQECQQTAQMPQESQQTAQMPQENQQTAETPKESQQNAAIPKESQETAEMPRESQQNAEIPQESQQTAETPKESQQNAAIPKGSQENAEMPQESQQESQLSKIKSIEDQLNIVAEKVKVFKPNGSTENNKEYLWLEEMLMRILMGLDAIEANGNKEIRGARKEVVKRVQVALNELETKSPAGKNKS